MIDPIEVIITAAEADAGIAGEVGDQVAIRHRFGTGSGGWTVGSKAVTFRLDGGAPDIDTPIQDVRIEVRAYGGDFLEAFEVVGAVIDWARALRRSTVVVTGGNGILYHVTPETSPASMVDADLETPFYLFFIMASVAEEDVP